MVFLPYSHAHQLRRELYPQGEGDGGGDGDGGGGGGGGRAIEGLQADFAVPALRVYETSSDLLSTDVEDDEIQQGAGAEASEARRFYHPLRLQDETRRRNAGDV